MISAAGSSGGQIDWHHTLSSWIEPYCTLVFFILISDSKDKLSDGSS
jgi:hypothetical protein